MKKFYDYAFTYAEMHVSILKYNPSRLHTTMEDRKEENQVSILDIHCNVI